MVPFLTMFEGGVWGRRRAGAAASGAGGLLVVCVALLAVCVDATWTQDRFLISFWVDPPCTTDDTCAQYLGDVAAANFTVARAV